MTYCRHGRGMVVVVPELDSDIVVGVLLLVKERWRWWMLW